MENIKKYNSYEDFVNDNIGSKKYVVVYGSGGQSQPLGGATKDSIEKQFRGMIYHEFLDSEFYYNYTSSDNIKDEYKSFVKEFYNSLLESPKEFASFWQNNMTKSGDYDSLYQLKNKYKNIDTNYNHSTGDKRVNSESEYVLAIKNDRGQTIKYVPTEKPESYTFYIFSKFKNKMSDKLKKEYSDYRKRYAGEDIKFNEGGSIKSKGTFKPLGSAKELGIKPKIDGHDMIAKCDCGEKFSYQNSKKNIIWECPECRGMKRISDSKMANGGSVSKKEMISGVLEQFILNTKFNSTSYPNERFAFAIDKPSANSIWFRTKYFGDWKDNIQVSIGRRDDFFRIRKADNESIKTTNYKLLGDMLNVLHKEKKQKYNDYLTNEYTTKNEIHNSLVD